MSRRAAIAFVVCATLVAIVVRVVVAPEGGGLVDVDGDLHLRRALDVLARGPGALRGIDPMLAWPDGAHVQWPPGFDLLLAAIARVFGPARLEIAASVAIPILGGLAVPAAWGLARTVLDRGGAAAVAAVVAVLPAHVELTRIGRVDHHVVEPTLIWAALACLVSGRAIAAGGLLALLFACAPSALIGAALFGAAALWLARNDARTPAIALATAAILVAVLAAAMGTLGTLTLDEVSGLPALLLALAAGGVVLARRKLPLLGAVGALVAAATLLLARGSAAFHLAGRGGLIGTVLETKSLFAFGAFAAFAPLTPLVFLAPFAAGIAWRRRGGGDARAIVYASGFLLLALTIVQRRWMHLCAAPLAIMIVDALQLLHGRRLAYAAGATLAIALPLPIYYLAHQPPDSARDRAVRDIAPLLRGLPPGGVLAQWPLGHILARLGDHPVVGSPLLTPATEAANAEATRILLDDDPARVLARIDARRVRYVVATAVPLAALPRYLAALGDGRAPDRVMHASLAQRLLRDDGDGIAGLREIASSADGRAKLFERVAGAQVEGTAPPETDVSAAVPIIATSISDEHARWRRFFIRLRTRSGPDGRFRLALPYPTRPDPTDATMVRAAGPWQFAFDGQPPKAIDLSLADVRNGSVVVLR